MGFAVAYWGNDALAAECFAGRTTGQVVDQGVYAMLLGIGFGILTEISRSLVPKE